MARGSDAVFRLAPLPFATGALAPHISERAMALHHGTHHKGYIDALNDLLDGDGLFELPLELVIKRSHGLIARQSIFNNAAQCWNHDFFWGSVKPGGGGVPTGRVKALIDQDFGNVRQFRLAFLDAAARHFGSGWLWLTLTGGRLEIGTTHDADLPLVHGATALLVCDLWEHAYYLDHESRRAEFVAAFFDHLANWDFANANLIKAG
jgi:Fe-Mn family superoxide dismutase